jgi:hypothetical protein
MSHWQNQDASCHLRARERARSTPSRASQLVCRLIVLMTALSPTWTFAGARAKELTDLVGYRRTAIENSFGETFGALPDDIRLKVFEERDPQFRELESRIGYDVATRTLLLPKTLVYQQMPPASLAKMYWPPYRDELFMDAYPIVRAIDDALWNVYLQESARATGASWPHPDCRELRMAQRLPCEVLVSGVFEYVRAPQAPLFNENRLSALWSEDFAELCKRMDSSLDRDYVAIRRYGGILLLRPLVAEFGLSRTLSFVARHPFRVESDMQQAARDYQEAARQALRM